MTEQRYAMPEGQSMNLHTARLIDDIGCSDIDGISTYLVRAAAGATLFRVNDACRHGLIVLDGCARVSRHSSSGPEVVLYRVFAGECCAITSACALGMTRYPAQGHAETDVLALALPLPRFHRQIEQSPRFRSVVFGQHARRIGDLIARIESIASERVETRIARRLLARSVDGRVAATHSQIASDICSTREVVSRALKALERRGWVRLHRNLVEVLQRDGLHGLLARL
jgi:CRP/FNR family transcriptional regulator